MNTRDPNQVTNGSGAESDAWLDAILYEYARLSSEHGAPTDSEQDAAFRARCRDSSWAAPIAAGAPKKTESGTPARAFDSPGAARLLRYSLISARLLRYSLISMTALFAIVICFGIFLRHSNLRPAIVAIDKNLALEAIGKESSARSPLELYLKHSPGDLAVFLDLSQSLDSRKIQTITPALAEALKDSAALFDGIKFARSTGSAWAASRHFYWGPPPLIHDFDASSAQSNYVNNMSSAREEFLAEARRRDAQIRSAQYQTRRDSEIGEFQQRLMKEVASSRVRTHRDGFPLLVIDQGSSFTLVITDSVPDCQLSAHHHDAVMDSRVIILVVPSSDATNSRLRNGRSFCLGSLPPFGSTPEIILPRVIHPNELNKLKEYFAAGIPTQAGTDTAPSSR